MTGRACVDLIVTDIAVMNVAEAGLQLAEVAPGWTPADVQMLTEATLITASDVREISL